MKISLISFKEIMEGLIFNECYSIACTISEDFFDWERCDKSKNENYFTHMYSVI